MIDDLKTEVDAQQAQIDEIKSALVKKNIL
jgi:hypothetical protein